MEESDEEENEYGFPEIFKPEDFTNLSDEEEVQAEQAKAVEADAGFPGSLKPVDCERALLKGTTFKSWEHFNQTVSEYKAVTGMKFRREKKDKFIAVGQCRGHKKVNGGDCKVEFSARCMKKTGKITMQKVHLNHTCDTTIHEFRNGSHKTQWVAGKLMAHVRVNPNTTITHLNETLRSCHQAQSKKWSVGRARAKCREEIFGGTAESFQRIPKYVERLRERDRNVHAYYQTGEERRFGRLFVAPSATQTTFMHCRPLVGLDGTHTVGKFPMIVLLACCFDRENHIVVLAWAVVKVENNDNWSWFTEHLRISFPKMRQADTVFISDHDKGLRGAVAESFPNGHHAHCVQHLRANIKGNVDVFCSKYFKQVAMAKTEADFEKLLVGFKPTTERQQNFVAYVRKINPGLYARHVFAMRRYGHTTSNVVEIINHAIKPARALPALMLSEFMWTYVMERHYERAQHAQALPEGEFAVTEYANHMLLHLYRESRTIKEIRSSDTQSLMVDAKGKWAIDLETHFCECTYWYEMDLPCSHAVCSLSKRGHDSKKFVGSVWLASTQRKAYSVPLPPVSIDRLDMLEDSCFAPVINKKKKTKNSVKRAPGWGDQLARRNERYVKKQSQKCSLCNLPGHNARGCPSFPPASATATATAITAPRAQSSMADPSHAHGSHDTLVVGSEVTATRIQEDDDWLLYNTRQNTQSYMDHYNEDRFNSQTGPSQVTQ